MGQSFTRAVYFVITRYCELVIYSLCMLLHSVDVLSAIPKHILGMAHGDV